LVSIGDGIGDAGSWTSPADGRAPRGERDRERARVCAGADAWRWFAEGV